MTTKYGMFSEHPATAGTPVVPLTKLKAGEERPTDRDGHGLNMKAGTTKLGKGNDATFGRFLPLHEGDKYVDPLRLQLKAKAAARGKNVTDSPFKGASPMKKSVTPGDYFGTSGKYEHLPGTIEVKKKKGEIPEQPKGIYTGPAKKGTFGYNKTTLSERMGYKGVATEYEYQHDPTQLHDQQRREHMEASRKARVTELPFKPSHPTKKGGYGVPNTTISKGKGIVGEWEYVVGAAPKPAPAPATKEGQAPFRPSHTFASQRIEHIEYIHDPEVPKIKAEAARRKAEAEKIAGGGAWRPNMGYKTDMVRSIVRMNLR